MMPFMGAGLAATLKPRTVALGREAVGRAYLAWFWRCS